MNKDKSEGMVSRNEVRRTAIIDFNYFWGGVEGVVVTANIAAIDNSQ